jgi:hypothetical protein
MGMEIDFYKVDDGRGCTWVAAPAGRRPFQGSTMAAGGDLPHDLVHFVVESTLDLQHGFWGLVANGASFKSIPGRRPTKPGRQLIKTHGEALNRAEAIVNEHWWAWRRGAATPMGAALDAMTARWQALAVGEPLRVEWPTRRLSGGRKAVSTPRCFRRPRAARKGG